MDLSNDMGFLATGISVVTGGKVFEKKVVSCWDELDGLNPHFHCEKENCAHTKWSWQCLIPTLCLHCNAFPDWQESSRHILRQGNLNDQILTYFCPKPKTTSETILNVKTLTGRKVEVLIDRSCSVLTLKEKIQDAEGIPPNSQMILSLGVIFDDGRAISDYEIQENTVHLILQLGPVGHHAYILDKEMFDSSKNCDFTWLQDDGQIFKRGNHVYQRPYGWNRIAFNVKNKYDDNRWLGEDPGSDFERSEGLKDEWPMAYHGKVKLLFTTLNTEDSNSSKRSELVRGIYSCPDPKVAEQSAPVFTYKSRKFKVMIQSRVNMNDTLIVGDQRFYATANPENIRPVGLLIKSLR